MYVSFLGLGQCGGNIADEAASRGFYSASINFSQTDLNSLEHTKKTLKLIGSEGVGKNRENAIMMMESNWDIATNFVKEHFSHPSVEIIIVPFATGGGSGSGIAPVLLSLLVSEMPDKVFVAMPIIPDKSEPYTNQKNCLDCFEDLAKINICVLPIDNQKYSLRMAHGSKSRYFEKINKEIVNLFEEILLYTNKQSKYGVFDKKDLTALFKTQGIGSIAKADLSIVTNKIEFNERGITNKIKESWIKSIFADIELNQIISASIIFEGKEEILNLINSERLFDCFGNKMPISLFEGFYTTSDGKSFGKVITILSGLAWCNSRLKEIDEILESVIEKFNNRSQTGFYVSKTKHLQSKSPLENTREKVNDISELISRFKR